MFTSVARNTSEASPNSWGLQKFFGIFGLLGAILDGSGETFRGAESYHLISEKVGKNRKFLEES